MNRKKTLSTTSVLLLLSILSLLSIFSLNMVRVSAVPVSPYIMVIPEKTLDSTYTVGSNYTVSIYTNYNASLGSDLYSWQFSLTFNSSILEGLEVRNGDLITTAKHSSARFGPGTFDNTIGKLSLTIAYFYHISPPPFRTTGPGTLAYVTFRVKGYGVSDIHLSDTWADPPTMLGGYNIAEGGYYEIMDGTIESEKLGHGFFSNRLAGDTDGDRDVDYSDFIVLAGAYGSTIGQPAYKRNADFDVDGDVDYTDFIALAGNYGKSI